MDTRYLHAIEGEYQMDAHVLPTQKEIDFCDDHRTGVYRAIFERRDVRGQFLPDEIPDEVISRILMAAHHAPSVGFMQPWDFMMIKSGDVKQKVHGLFKKAHDEAAEMFDEERRETYRNLKLEGILESPLNIVITCDRDRSGPVVVGRTHQKTMDLYSSVCAVQNLWLAARAEGLGVGWVSIMDEPALKEVLGIPKRITVIGYLCVGYVSHFYQKPELEMAKWRERLPMDKIMHFDQWGNAEENDLTEQVRKDQAVAQEGRFLEDVV
ncbi:5,6-dimethylbenzimidazole synthase [Terasakiella sp. A23]|uniref:5,6-dimethylbenzimidazole synthase n=1 Tax=Terasakiella sp. FCG-A23 TaxID=3080561 RepID=UPI002953B031|nr:5,6-dimethylbenzimidazole synthase [Terasakiella sp. A23]MDV7340466.1 5,6-dimethylbenzimidazole synthase [Terasakiella sp. A23]